MRFLDLLKQRVVIFDGAMGSQIQNVELTADDFGGAALEGCNENLVCTRPDVIATIHRQYFDAGADVVETDTFGATSIVLAEYDLADEALHINRTAAQIARREADACTTKDRPRFVAGSVGPGTKLPTLGHIDFRDMVPAYRTQCTGLLEGGVDLFTLETCQDLLQAKAAIIGAHEAMRDTGITVPVMVSITIEQTGTMLIGTEVGAALTALAPYGIDIIGMNCATGPKEMEDNVRYLSRNAPMPIAVIPNAGLPENVGGRAHYHLSPEEFVKWQTYFVEHYGVNVVGGCCGTTPAHIRALYSALHGKAVPPRTTEWIPAVTSIYSAVPLDQEPKPLLVGERTNANGSKKFRELLQDDQWDGLVDMGKEQVAEGAHLLDVCVAYVGRNELADMEATVRRFVTQIPLPLMIDSTESPVLERALQLCGGRCVINSINLEDGRARLDTVVGLARRYGAAVVALTIDEDGMAKTAERKLAVARRIFDLCVTEHNLRPEDLLFDPLTFTIGSGDAEFRDAGVQTLDGIRRIKAALPGVRTLLGLSNISFGLQPTSRVVLNSVFMREAVAAGLDAAIVHASKILPLNRIPDEAQQLALRLIHNDHTAGDPLIAFMAYFDTNTVATGTTTVDDSDQPLPERLKRRIVHGNKKDLHSLLDQALQTTAALEIINTILLDGMKVVGELFGAGKMQLPFVLQSAEVMKTAVAHLEPHMDRVDGQSKGKIVLATVKGDVHDIGKNLVDIILTNNGYSVVNLGIKVGLEQMLHAAEEHQANAIGMSGLLVKSTAIMKENLEEMAHRQLSIPVICGGAALTRSFVEKELSGAYQRTVFYGKDAFEGLRVMEQLKSGTLRVADVAPPAAPRAAAAAPAPVGARSAIRPRAPVPAPPFWGTKVVGDIALVRIFPYINKTALYKGQWQFRQGKMNKAEYDALRQDTIEPLFAGLTDRVTRERIFAPQVVYGYFPCQADGNALVIYDQPATPRERARFTFPRQPQPPHYCIADFFHPVESGIMDVIGMHVVTVGAHCKTICQQYYDAGRYTDYLYLHGLSVETAEALAEYWHKVIRVELGIAGDDAATLEQLFHQKYHGSRYSFGYPACPNLEDQTMLFGLLQPDRIGVTLSETHQMDPEASTSALIVHHPQAKYFDVK